MPYDPQKELKRVVDYYNQDPMQERFSAIISGDSGAGKTFLLKTARFPIHIDSFDPGGTKSIAELIRNKNNPNGQIIADTSYEIEDPYEPTAYDRWKKDVEVRLQIGYFDMFGTYVLDSLSTFGAAVMNYIMKNAKGGSRAGEVPMHRRDYNPQKTEIVNRIKKLMSLKCDFFLMAHLNESEDTIGMTKEGLPIKTEKYRLKITGDAIVTIPLQFDELYVLLGKGSPVKRELILDSQGKYIARSRLNREGKLSHSEEPNIKKLLKKAGLKWEDKEPLEM